MRLLGKLKPNPSNFAILISIGQNGSYVIQWNNIFFYYHKSNQERVFFIIMGGII